VKGGHGRSGPPPDPEALRRDRPSDAVWVVLPVTGRSGPPPEWPLTDASSRELHWWRRLWAKPQAVQWERLGLVDDVALYVRRLAEVELPGASAAAANHLIRLSESLGLTTAGMRMNRWQIAAEQPAPQQLAAAGGGTAAVGGSRPARRSARDRLKVVGRDGAS
jgi:hypothetical protein